MVRYESLYAMYVRPLANYANSSQPTTLLPNAMLPNAMTYINQALLRRLLGMSMQR